MRLPWLESQASRCPSYRLYPNLPKTALITIKELTASMQPYTSMNL